MMLRKAIVNASKTITVEWRRARIREAYLEWKNGLPEGHISRFVEEGLTPFLKRNGYEVCYSSKNLTQACKEWAFAHVQIQEKGADLYDRFFVKCAHYGGEDEFDWYGHSIPFERWEALAAKWAAPGFLDDSDVGYAQIVDIAHFAWQLVHLDSSPTHIRWKEYTEQYEYDDDYGRSSYAQPSEVHPTEEAGAYGGDRRTL